MDSKLVLSLDKKYKTLLEKYGVNTPLRKANFWGQIFHESACKPIQENLNYSVDGLLKTFPKYFLSRAAAEKYARKPQDIASRVYANRMGNGGESTKEGWRYSGKGFIQITGKENYKKLSESTNIDFINHPDLLLEETNSLIAALWYWNKIKGNEFADKDDVKSITFLINGGFNGLEDRKKNVEELKKIFK